MPYKDEAQQVLAMWRDVERRIQAVPPDSDGARRLVDEWARLRVEYQRLTDLAREHHRPVPDPWPISSDQTIKDFSDPKRRLADKSDEMLDELAHLKATEDLKRKEPISTPPYHRLADEVTASSRRIFDIGAREMELGDQAETGEETIDGLDRSSEAAKT